MITALVLFGILAVCAFLEWIVMIPLAGRDRMKAWKETDPIGWNKFKMMMGLPLLAVLCVVGAFYGASDHMDKPSMIVLMIVVAVVVFVGFNLLIMFVIRKKGNEALEKLAQQEKEKREAEAAAPKGPKPWICPKCGTRNDGNSRYCSLCSEHKPQD